MFLGVLKLSIDTDIGKIIHHTEEKELKEVLTDEDRLYDREVEKIVHAYNSRIQKEYGRGVGETSVDLAR